MADFREFTRILDGEHVIDEAGKFMSVETVLLASGAALSAGTVMAKVTATGLWAPFVQGAADGTETARGILKDNKKARAGNTTRAVIHVRDCVVNGKKITWPAGLSAPNRATQEANLAQTGVLVRY